MTLKPSKAMRKYASFCTYLLLITLFFQGGQATALQFYKPNRGARLIVYLKAKSQYEKRGAIPVTVMLSNQTQEPLLINNRMRTNRYPLDGELAFIIEGPKHTELALQKRITPRDIRPADLFVLGVGETSEQTVDLADLYDMNKHGTYRVQALYYNRADLEKDGRRTWRGVIASEPVDMTLR